MPRGRPSTIDPDRLAHEALTLFEQFGFADVTMEQIAERAKVSRSTLFRYFPSKHALVWGGLETTIERIEAALRTVPPTQDAIGALVEVYRTAFDLPAVARLRLRLIAEQSSLLSYGAPRLGPTRDTVASYLERQGWGEAQGLHVQAVAAAVAATTITALSWWATTDDARQPGVIVAEALHHLKTLT